MEYGYQKVLEVQRRCGVSFEDADRALKAEKGDVDKACAYAMRRKKNSEEMNKKMGSFRNFITYRTKIQKNGKTSFDISLGTILLFSLIVLIFSLAIDEAGMLLILYFCIFLISVFTGHTLILEPQKQSGDEKLETVVVDDVPSEEIIEEIVNNEEINPEDDGFNTIEIE